MQRAIKIVIVLVVLNLPLSCNDDLDCGFVPQEARIAAVDAKIGAFGSDFSDQFSTDYRRAAIQIRIEEMEYTAIASTVENGFSILNQAFACSPPEPEPTQILSSIMIKGEAPIFSNGERFEAGSNLVSLFQVASYSGTTQNISVAEFLQRQEEDPWIFGHLYADIVLQLINRPDSIIQQPLTITIEFSDSESLSLDTSIFEVHN